MSFDVYLKNAGPVERFTDGGTYALGGTVEPELNITYNYSPHYYKHLDNESGLRALDGQRAGDWISRLAHAVDVLGTDRHSDYWEPTEGNAGAALARLLEFAKQYPDGVWEVR